MNDETQLAERTRLGDNCKDAQIVVDRAEGELADSNSLIGSWRVKKQGFMTELDVLNDKDEDSLSYDLRLRKLDLQKDAEELEQFIAGNLKRQIGLKHSIEMANLGLTGARTAYRDYTSGSDGVTQSQIEEMKSIPRTSKMMTEQRRTDIISKMGMNFYNSISLV